MSKNCAILSHISFLIASFLLLFVVSSMNNIRQNVGQRSLSFALFVSNQSSLQREGVKGQQLGLVLQHYLLRKFSLPGLSGSPFCIWVWAKRPADASFQILMFSSQRFLIKSSDKRGESLSVLFLLWHSHVFFMYKQGLALVYRFSPLLGGCQVNLSPRGTVENYTCFPSISLAVSRYAWDTFVESEERWKCQMTGEACRSKQAELRAIWIKAEY